MTNASLSLHVSSAARLPLSCSCFQTGFQNEFFVFFCSVAISVGLRGTSGDNQSDTASLASWTATCQLLRYSSLFEWSSQKQRRLVGIQRHQKCFILMLNVFLPLRSRCKRGDFFFIVKMFYMGAFFVFFFHKRVSSRA